MWHWDDPDDPRNTVMQNDCPNPECAQGHVRLKPTYNSSVVQVRAEQRAVVYQFPDGSWAQPGTNDPNDPVAQTSIRDGAVRREFYHIRDMHEFQRSLRKTAGDELSGYNDVVDFDEAARRQSDTTTMDVEKLHMREQRLKDAFELIGGGKGKLTIDEYRRRGWVR